MANDQTTEADDRPIEVTAPPEGSSVSLFSPEGVLILMIAIFLDLLGAIIAIIAIIVALFTGGAGVVIELISFVPDILGILTIGVWAFIRTGKIPFTKKLARFAKRPLLIIIGESIPFVGALPLWSLYVFFKLKK